MTKTEKRPSEPDDSADKTAGSAFPIANEYYPDGEVEYGQGGMTLRDYFAAKALQAIISHPQGKAGQWGEASQDAYLAADAMLISRQNETNP